MEENLIKYIDDIAQGGSVTSFFVVVYFIYNRVKKHVDEQRKEINDKLDKLIELIKDKGNG